MVLDPMAGKPAGNDMLENIPRLVALYYSTRPDPSDPSQRVSFGTSGHRGSSLKKSFCEAHILAISQALADYRKTKGIDGPLFIGIDTHALSEPAFISALEVFAGNGITVMIQQGGGYTPTPVISHAILTYNKNRTTGLADGVVITPSHNPPSDGGFKYNPTNGGPADTDITSIMESSANVYLEKNLDGVVRIPYEKAVKADTTIEHDYVMPYINDLENVVDMAKISESGLKIGADPLGGSGVAYWDLIAERYKLDIEVVNDRVDPSFSFMTLDKDGKIRMDCSSPYAMAGLIGLKDRFDIAFANDPDFDRHGIVTRSKGILNPNHYLAVAIDYLCKNRPAWGSDKAIGKTLVSSSMIDKVANDLGRKIIEVPVGFKWFVPGLNDGSVCFGGEESAGASFLRHDGSVWSTDKDGIIMNLLSAEMISVTGKDPGELYDELTRKHGAPVYERIDAPATPEQKTILKNLSPAQVSADNLAGDPITGKLTKAPGNGAGIGGLKVITDNGWFAARPSGTEDVYKIYAESFVSTDHLGRIQKEAKEIVDTAFSALADA